MPKGQKAAPRAEWGNNRKSNQNRWKKENRSVLGADLPKQEGDSFRALCKAQGVSISAALSVFVRACIDCNSLDVIRDDIPGQKNIDPAFQQGDQAGENDTPGTVDLPTANDTPGAVDLPTANDTPGTV